MVGDAEGEAEGMRGEADGRADGVGVFAPVHAHPAATAISAVKSSAAAK